MDKESKAVFVPWRKVGNSTGLLLPKHILVDSGFANFEGVDLTIEDGAMVLRPPSPGLRAGWAEAAARIKEAGERRALAARRR